MEILLNRETLQSRSNRKTTKKILNDKGWDSEWNRSAILGRLAFFAGQISASGGRYGVGMVGG
jgi:hypothetical protein